MAFVSWGDKVGAKFSDETNCNLKSDDFWTVFKNIFEVEGNGGLISENGKLSSGIFSSTLAVEHERVVQKK